MAIGGIFLIMTLMDSPFAADILALACGVAGWFYLFYSKAAAKLAGIESARRNSLRVALRRVCGAALVVLGAAFYAGFNIDEHRNPGAYLGVWSAALLLLLIIIILVAADLSFTFKLRRERKPERQNKPPGDA
jgi:hypothetical protein